MEGPLAGSDFAQNLRDSPQPNSPLVTSIISSLHLQAHPEGGYYAETDRDPLLIPNPFKPDSDSVRNASTTIYYLLSQASPVGHFHRNEARTVHTLHRGRGRYLIIHEDGTIETFVVGHDLVEGEKLQWIVEGGKYKASHLLPDGSESDGGLLISETVVPGFEFEDHDFLTAEGLKALVREEQVLELGWLLNEKERGKLKPV